MKNHVIKCSLLTAASLITLCYGQDLSCKVKQQPKTEDVDTEDSWEDIFTQMHKNFAKMHQRMEEDFRTLTSQMNSAIDRTPMPSLSTTGDDKALTITLSGITNENIEATTHDNERLTIKTPDINLELTVRDHVLHAQMTQEQKTEEEKDGAKKHLSSFSHAETYQTVANELDLDNAKVRFAEKDQNLVISIPFFPEKQGKALKIEVDKTQKTTTEK